MCSVDGVESQHQREVACDDRSAARRDVGGAACGSMFFLAGGHMKKGISGAVDVPACLACTELTQCGVQAFNASSTTGGKPVASFMIPQLVSPRIGCLKDRYVLVSGGYGSKGCNSQVFTLDTQAMPASGTALPALKGVLSSKFQVAVATNGGDTAMFFDGTNGDLFSI